GRWSDAGGIRQLTRAQKGAEIVGVQRDERPRSARVCARLESLFAFYLEEGADLGQNVRRRAGIHSPNLRGRGRRLRLLLPLRRGKEESSRSLRSASESTRAPGWRPRCRACRGASSPLRGSCT